ncbi:hypothetical protein AVEN_159324-1 [Araneus ventricosus]|uniref:Uncharacterized protein n=1 Tax=Araneus ventricosus TaxID=182803 RepID=A0A4Y2A0K4_ARAVE|nr:hypothetical protein AVEN_159324-1 [Araneus ventricosus]
MWTKERPDKFPFSLLMIWGESRDHLSDCYFCIVNTSGYNKKNKCKIDYSSLPSGMRPMLHSVEFPGPVFKELPSLEIQEYDFVEDRSDPNDEDFEIEDDSVRKGFKQHELNDLARDFGLSEKASELIASSTRKGCLKNELRYPIFDQEKVRFCNTFEVMMDLCIAVTYMV